MSKTPPSPSLRVTCVQTDAPCAPHDLTALLDDAATRRPADLYLLPELCTVPYLSTAEVLRARAETVDGPTASALCRWTAAHDAVVLAGLVERGEHGLHNSVLVVDAGRVRGLYRKRHLTRYEKGLFLPGTENGLFQIRGHLVGIMVCFDLWFPETPFATQHGYTRDRTAARGPAGAAFPRPACQARRWPRPRPDG